MVNLSVQKTLNKIKLCTLNILEEIHPDKNLGVTSCTFTVFWTLEKMVNLNVLLNMPHLSTAVAWREKKFKHFVFNKYFSLVLGVLKSKISKKSVDSFLRKLDLKLFHYKAMVQPVRKITTIATRNRCWM